MVPEVGTRGGFSFHGSFAYYLHDKRQEGEAVRITSERVGWTETRNLATADPHLAQRIMIATAQQADELKRAAGLRAGRDKKTGAVFTYSLSWHPDEAGTIDRAEMIRAVDQTLKLLDAENRQAVIICHTDTAHPHVHVILNRVDPDNGRLLSGGNDRLKLSKWRERYEQERGQHFTRHWHSTDRAKEQFQESAEPEKAERPKRTRDRTRKKEGGPDLDQVKAAPGPAQVLAQAKPAAAPTKAQERPEAAPAPIAPAASPTAPTRPQRPKSEASILKELSDAQKARHKQEWTDLAARNKTARDAVYSDFGATIKATAERQKTHTKPLWRSFFQELRKVERAFQSREKSLSGMIRNAFDAAIHQQKSGALGQRGILSATFRNVLDAQARAEAFQKEQGFARAAMSRAIKTDLDAEISRLKEQRGAALAAQRQAYAQERAAMIDRQNAEKAKTREAWRQVYERRGKDPAYQERRQRQKPAPLMEQRPMKQPFEKAREVPRTDPAPRYPTDQRMISTPAPAPPPPAPTPPHRELRDVPRPEVAAIWRKKPEARPEPTRTDFPRAVSRPERPAAKEPAPRVADVFARNRDEITRAGQPEKRGASPADHFERARKEQDAATKAPEAEKARSWTDSWKARAKERAAERGEQPRDKSKDLDFDRER